MGLDRIIINRPREVRAEDALDLVAVRGRGRRRGGLGRGRLGGRRRGLGLLLGLLRRLARGLVVDL